jgi:hypothetical protein
MVALEILLTKKFKFLKIRLGLTQPISDEYFERNFERNFCHRERNLLKWHMKLLYYYIFANQNN